MKGFQMEAFFIFINDLLICFKYLVDLVIETIKLEFLKNLIKLLCVYKLAENFEKRHNIDNRRHKIIFSTVLQS